MKLDGNKVNKIIDRLEGSTANTFRSLCGQLFNYLEDTASTNKVYVKFCNEIPRWVAWKQEVGGVDGRTWAPPVDIQSAKSHAFALYKLSAIGEFDPIRLYFGINRFDDAISQFNDDFIGPLTDALLDIVSSEEFSEPQCVSSPGSINFDIGQMPKENERLTPAEMEVVCDKLEKLQRFIEDSVLQIHGQLDAQDEKMEEIRQRIRALQDASRSMGKKDLWCLLLGTMTSLTLQGIVPPEITMDIYPKLGI